MFGGEGLGLGFRRLGLRLRSRARAQGVEGLVLRFGDLGCRVQGSVVRVQGAGLELRGWGYSAGIASACTATRCSSPTAPHFLRILVYLVIYDAG